MIAVGIGLHNFSEGLAIGQSAATGEISLALVLIIGFGLHNATEGFGIVAPARRPRRAAELAVPRSLMGLIGGGPTFFGTLLGQPGSATASRSSSSRSPPARSSTSSSSFGVCRRSATERSSPGGSSPGSSLGFATDFVLVAAGA